MKRLLFLLCALAVVGCGQQAKQSSKVSSVEQKAKAPECQVRDNECQVRDNERQAWDNERHPLYGDVKSIVTIVHTLNPDSGEQAQYIVDTVQQAWFNEVGDMDHRLLYDRIERASYDEQQRLVALSSFSLDEELKTVRYYIYDDAGELVEERGLDGQGELTHKWLYDYNASKQMLSSSFTSMDGRNSMRQIFNYAEGRLIEQQYYEFDKLSGYLLFKYDAKGKLIERTFFAGKDLPMNRILFRYDAAGNTIEELHQIYKSAEECVPMQRYCYEYDDRGNRIKKEDYYYDEQGVEHLNLLDKYSYDSHDNVILSEFFRATDLEQACSRFEVHITYRE